MPTPDLVTLYSETDTLDRTQADIFFLPHAVLPPLFSFQCDGLENLIELEEVLLAIKSIKSNKHLCPMGSQPSTIKDLPNLFAPMLAKDYNAILKGPSIQR